MSNEKGQNKRQSSFGSFSPSIWKIRKQVTFVFLTSMARSLLKL